MPNGVDKNFVRLAIACAALKSKYGEWPSEARVAPYVIWDFAQLFDLENFEALCVRIRLRTTDHAGIAVGNAEHHVAYDSLSAYPEPVDVTEAIRWLGATIRPELQHLD